MRQRGLLLEKLEDFKRLNKLVRQKLKQLQDSEVGFPLSLPYLDSSTVIHNNEGNVSEIQYLKTVVFHVLYVGQ